MIDLRNKESYKIVEGQIQVHAVISFDLFDTLVKRDCWRPIELFHFVEEKVDKIFGVHSSFAEKRVQAEREARRRSPRNKMAPA